MIKPSHYTWGWIHLDYDWELPCYKQEVVQIASGDKTPDYNILRPIAFISKSLTHVEKDTAT